MNDIINTIRVWKEDTGEEFEARTSFFFKDIINVEEYVYHDNFQNKCRKSYVQVREVGSIVVLEDYESLMKKWKDFLKLPFKFQFQ